MSTAPTKPTWREWTGLALLALPLFMMATDFTVMYLALPAMAADLAPSTTQTLWIMHISEFVGAGLVITMGRLSDKIGRRRLLFSALALYGIASALAAYAPEPNTLLAARVLLGLAAAAAGPPTFSIVREMFPQAKHFGIAFAVLMGAFSAGAALGPPMGGVLLQYFWWGSVFLINVPAAALVLLGGWLLLPRTASTIRVRIDIASVALSMSAIMLTVYGLQEIAAEGLSPLYLAATIAGATLGTIFVRRQRRLTDPLLDLSLFRITALRVTAILLVLTSLGFGATDFILVQYLQIVVEVPMATLGLLLAAPGVATVIGTAITPALHRRIQASHLMALGLLASLAGTAGIIAAVLFTPHSIIAFGLSTTLLAFGLSPLLVLGSQLLITSAPPHQTGSAVAVQDVVTGMGGAGGLALFGSLSMLVYSRVLHAGAPDQMATSQVEAAAESTGGALSVVEDVGGATGRELLAAMRDALSMGTVTAHVAALLVGAAAIVLILRGLRGISLPNDDTPDDPDLADETPLVDTAR